MRQVHGPAAIRAKKQARQSRSYRLGDSVNLRVLVCVLLYAHHFFVGKSPARCEYLVPGPRIATCPAAALQDEPEPASDEAQDDSRTSH